MVDDGCRIYAEKRAKRETQKERNGMKGRSRRSNEEEQLKEQERE